MKERLERVEERIAKAAASAGRRRDEILLLAVTKKFSAEVMREAYEAGLRDFGENYVQEWEIKAPQLRDLPGARFHLIGHLQSNKARRAAELFDAVETVDTAKLAERLDQAGKMLDVMIEVKLSEEEAKSGTGANELPALIESIQQCPNLRLGGLMTMPPWTEDAEQSRPYFERLRKLAEVLCLKGLSLG
ncbi:MAG: YggS family pyridoxal phosphate-dependent enzyme, partial [Bryobacteraceae bacterium]